MKNLRIRKLDLNNKSDFNLYKKLKLSFLLELKTSNTQHIEYINIIEKEALNNTRATKIKNILPFLKQNLTVYVLEKKDNNTLINNDYEPISYISIITPIKSKQSTHAFNPQNTIAIENFYVKPEFRLNYETFEFLKSVINLATDGKNMSVIFNVLSSNPNKYFHFALADFIYDGYFIENPEGNSINEYYLCCKDTNKIINLSLKTIIEKAVQLQQEKTLKDTDIPISLIENLQKENLCQE